MKPHVRSCIRSSFTMQVKGDAYSSYALDPTSDISRGLCLPCTLFCIVLLLFFFGGGITNWLQFVIFAFQFTRVVLENHKQFIYFLLNLHYNDIIWYSSKWSFLNVAIKFWCISFVKNIFITLEAMLSQTDNVNTYSRYLFSFT